MAARRSRPRNLVAGLVGEAVVAGGGEGGKL